MKKEKKQQKKYVYSTVSLSRIPFWRPISGRRQNKLNKQYIWRNNYGEIYIKSDVAIGQQHRNIIDGILSIYKKKRINTDQSIDFLFSLHELRRFIQMSHIRYINESIEDMMKAIVTAKMNHITGYYIDREQIIWEFKEFKENIDWAIDTYATNQIQKIDKNKVVHLYRIRFSSLFSKLFLKETILYNFDKNKFKENIKQIVSLKNATLQAFVRFCLTQKNNSAWNIEFVLQQIAALDEEKKHTVSYRKAKSIIISAMRDKKNELQDFGICFSDNFKTFTIKEACKVYKFYFDCNFSQ